MIRKIKYTYTYKNIPTRVQARATLCSILSLWLHLPASIMQATVFFFLFIKVSGLSLRSCLYSSSVYRKISMNNNTGALSNRVTFWLLQYVVCFDLGDLGPKSKTVLKWSLFIGRWDIDPVTLINMTLMTWRASWTVSNSDPAPVSVTTEAAASVGWPSFSPQPIRGWFSLCSTTTIQFICNWEISHP